MASRLQEYSWKLSLCEMWLPASRYTVGGICVTVGVGQDHLHYAMPNVFYLSFHD